MLWLFQDPVVIMKAIMSWLFKDPINSSLAQFDHDQFEETVKNGLKAKKIKLVQMNFFLEKQLIKFSCTYEPLSFCKIFKKFQSYENVPFSGPKLPICPEQNFFGINHCYYFHYPPISPFDCAKLTSDPELKIGPKWSICPKQISFWKIIDIIFIYLLALSHCAKF